MDTIYKSSNKIHEMYKDLSYFDQYGTSVFIFIILIVVLFCIASYFYVLKNIQPIKDDWVNQRCKPTVMPFAGIINPPDGMTTSDFTNQNFSYCMQNILTSITGFAVEPITYATSMLSSLYNELAQAINTIKTMMSSIRTNISSISQEIMGRILNITTPLIQIIISIVDSLNKTIGILTAGLYTSLGTYYTLKSLMGAILQFVIIILITLASLIVGLWVVPFTWGAAISFTIIFIAIAIPLAIVVAFMTDVLHVKTTMSIPKAPKKPRICFDRGTILELKDGSRKDIETVAIGDELVDGGKITAKFVLDAKHAIMYRLNGILVSGTHQVKYGDKWIRVNEHPERKLVVDYNEPYLYCLNTTSKRIMVGNHVFADWDEVFEKELEVLKKSCLMIGVNSRELEDATFIHTYFDGGFHKSTMVEMKNGTTREIKDIRVGDVLRNGEIVYGIVELWSKKRHLLTDTKKFQIKGTIYDDYNSSIDSILEKY